MVDKDVQGVIAALLAARALEGATVVATSLDLPRAMPAQELAARWREASARAGHMTVRAIDDPLAALDAAMPADGAGLTVVAGSLYLVGAVRAHLVDDPALRDPVAHVPPAEIAR